MMKYYTKMVWQRIRTQKLASLINIGGLSISLAAVLIIARWVQNERSFDNFHSNADRIFLIASLAQTTGNEVPAEENTPYAIGEAIKAEIPDIEMTTQMMRSQSNEVVLKVNNELFVEEYGVYVDENWFNVFNYRFRQGSSSAFFSDPYSLILTENRAKKLFGKTDVLGNVVKIDSTTFTIRGIIEDNPANSSLQFDVIFPIKAKLNTRRRLEDASAWLYSFAKTFIKIDQTAVPATVEKKLNNLISKHETAKINVGLLPLTRMYFNHDFSWSAFKHGDSQQVTIFTWLAIILLISACINYVNFSIAKTGDRFKEISIRKINGASSWQLFIQVMAEAFLNTLIATGIAVMVSILCIPLLKDLSEPVFADFTISSQYIFIMAIVLIAVVLLTGIYPAFMLSSLKTMNLLKGHMILNVRNALFKKGLIVVQFGFAIFMIIATIVVKRQLVFIQKENSAYNKSQVITARIPFDDFYKRFRFTADQEENKKTVLRQEGFLAAIKQELLTVPQIKTVARSGLSSVVNDIYVTGGDLNWDGKPENFNPAYTSFAAEPSIADIMNLELKEGRWFYDNNESDKNNVILNETAVTSFGLEHPVLGKRMNKGIVIGIVKDFFTKSMHEQITPLVYRINGALASAFVIETHPGNVENALNNTKEIWKKYFPNSPFYYSFADDEFNKLYSADQNSLKFALIFSGLSILISCLGLLGITIYMISKRQKEIGIRKVLGATITNIAVLLSKDFLKLIMLSVIIATPVGWWVMNSWLQDYQYRISISWWILASAGLLGLFIAFTTLSIQSVKAALVNPANSLRSE